MQHAPPQSELGVGPHSNSRLSIFPDRAQLSFGAYQALDIHPGLCRILVRILSV